MGMRIGGSGAASVNQSNTVGNWQQRQQNMKALGAALQGGDLAAAQQAFATISANNPAAAANTNSPLAQIGQALQAGDLGAAQQAAQAWRGSRHEGAGAQAANANPLANVNATTSTFLQTLTPIAGAPAGAASTSATTTAAAGVSSTATSDQIAQALAAFERNLFDSLQAQDAAGTSAASANAAGSAPATAQVAAAAPGTGATAPVQGHHHHHGGGAAADAKLGAELGSLIAQTSAAATDPSTAATAPAAATATSTASLDQSFKNLLNTLGVSGNNASLNTFLQAMSANMQSQGAGIAPAAAAASSA
ncbi:MAG: hypothetical protein WCK81_08625 [Betaproteobacteria bacterium]